MNNYKSMIEKMNLLTSVIINNKMGIDIKLNNLIHCQIDYWEEFNELTWSFIRNDFDRHIFLDYRFEIVYSLEDNWKIYFRGDPLQKWEIYDTDNDPSNFYNWNQYEVWDIYENIRNNYWKISDRTYKFIYFQIIKIDPNFLKKIDDKILELV